MFFFLVQSRVQRRNASELSRVGSSQVAVPTHIFKVVLFRAPDSSTFQPVAFIVPNASPTTFQNSPPSVLPEVLSEEASRSDPVPIALRRLVAGKTDFEALLAHAVPIDSVESAAGFLVFRKHRSK